MKIADDVVERALTAYWGTSWHGASLTEYTEHRLNAMRAAIAEAVATIRARGE